MCNPAIAIPLVMGGIQAASSISSYVSQKSEADRQNADNKKFYAANKQAAIDAAQAEEAQLTLRQSQDALAASAQIQDLTKIGESQRSTAVVSASEAGLTGNSVDAILNDIASKNGTNKTRTEQNLAMTTDQVQAQKSGVLVNAQNNINTVRQTVVRNPSIITPILQTAGASLSAADQYLARQAKINNTTP